MYISVCYVGINKSTAYACIRHVLRQIVELKCMNQTNSHYMYKNAIITIIITC